MEFRNLKRRVFAAAVLGLAVLGLLASATAAAKKPQALYWGAWIGKQLTGAEAPWDMSAASRLEETVHKPLSLIEFSSPFTDCSATPCSYYSFPTPQMQSIRNYGAIPVFSWNAASSGSAQKDAGFRLSDLIAGAYDPYIANFASEAKAWRHPFFLRFNWEMNGSWFPWSEGVNGNLPGEYVAAWRHVHDIFTAVGATNATWVWCPYTDAQNRLQSLAGLYPGDRYVDWTCLDGFNWGSDEGGSLPEHSFDQLFGRSYRQIVERIAPDKPMMLAELGTNGSGPARARWLQQMFNWIGTKYPQIRGLVWFDQADRGVQWPIEATTAGLRAFSTGLRAYPYRGNHYSEISARPIRPPR